MLLKKIKINFHCLFFHSLFFKSVKLYFSFFKSYTLFLYKKTYAGFRVTPGVTQGEKSGGFYRYS